MNIVYFSLINYIFFLIFRSICSTEIIQPFTFYILNIKIFSLKFSKFQIPSPPKATEISNEEDSSPQRYIAEHMQRPRSPTNMLNYIKSTCPPISVNNTSGSDCLSPQRVMSSRVQSSSPQRTLNSSGSFDCSSSIREISNILQSPSPPRAANISGGARCLSPERTQSGSPPRTANMSNGARCLSPTRVQSISPQRVQNSSASYNCLPSSQGASDYMQSVSSSSTSVGGSNSLSPQRSRMQSPQRIPHSSRTTLHSQSPPRGTNMNSGAGCLSPERTQSPPRASTTGGANMSNGSNCLSPQRGQNSSPQKLQNSSGSYNCPPLLKSTSNYMRSVCPTNIADLSSDFDFSSQQDYIRNSSPYRTNYIGTNTKSAYEHLLGQRNVPSRLQSSSPPGARNFSSDIECSSKNQYPSDQSDSLTVPFVADYSSGSDLSSSKRAISSNASLPKVANVPDVSSSPHTCVQKTSPQRSANLSKGFDNSLSQQNNTIHCKNLCPPNVADHASEISSRMFHRSQLKVPCSSRTEPDVSSDESNKTITASNFLHPSNANVAQSTQQSRYLQNKPNSDVEKKKTELFTKLTEFSQHGIPEQKTFEYLKHFEINGFSQIYWDDMKPVLEKQIANIETYSPCAGTERDNEEEIELTESRNKADVKPSDSKRKKSNRPRFDDNTYKNRIKRINQLKHEYQNIPFADEIEFLNLLNIPKHRLTYLMEDPDFDMIEKSPDAVAKYLNILYEKLDPNSISNIIPETKIMERNLDVGSMSSLTRGCVLPAKIPTSELNILDQKDYDFIDLQIKTASMPVPDIAYVCEVLKDFDFTEEDYDANISNSQYESVDYFVVLQVFKIQNFYKLKGSGMPKWCPPFVGPNPDAGYEIHEIISPCKILDNIWRASRPV